MFEMMQKGLCDTFLAKLGPFDSHFTFQGLWLTFLVKLNVIGCKFFAKWKYLGHILAWKFICKYILIIATYL